jgi:L-threonylcarbamoyladenylate synthase
MKHLSLSSSNLELCVSASTETLRNGGVILFPTDTLYGLGADAFSDEAVDRIYAIKGRDEKKPIHCIVSDIAMAEEYAEVTNDARLLFERLLPGGLTVILKKRDSVNGGIARTIDTIGIRIPNNDFCIQLAKKFDKPFTATSANIAGLQPQRSLSAILGQLGDAYKDIDILVDAGELPRSAPSTVVDLSNEEPSILREGAIPTDEVWNVIRSERDN